MSFSGCDSYGFPIYQRSFLRSSLLQGRGVSRKLMGAPFVHAPCPPPALCAQKVMLLSVCAASRRSPGCCHRRQNRFITLMQLGPSAFLPETLVAHTTVRSSNPNLPTFSIFKTNYLHKICENNVFSFTASFLFIPFCRGNHFQLFNQCIYLYL